MDDEREHRTPWHQVGARSDYPQRIHDLDGEPVVAVYGDQSTAAYVVAAVNEKAERDA